MVKSDIFFDHVLLIVSPLSLPPGTSIAFLNTCILIESKNSCSPCVEDIIWYYYCIISELQQNVWTMRNKLFADISSSCNVLRLPKLDNAVWDIAIHPSGWIAMFSTDSVPRFFLVNNDDYRNVNYSTQEAALPIYKTQAFNLYIYLYFTSK